MLISHTRRIGRNMAYLHMIKIKKGRKLMKAKRILAILLAVLMAVSVLPVSAFAADNVAAAGGTVPEDAVYYKGVTSTKPGDYTGGTAQIVMPDAPTTGDVYVCGDYEYRYNAYISKSVWTESEAQAGWGVAALDKTKTAYGEILSSISGADVVSLRETFRGCTALVAAPAIPEGVTNLYYTYYNCSALKAAPVIPEGVVTMTSTFLGCVTLTEAPVLPSTVTTMDYCFSGCTALVKAPEIPDSVQSMRQTFVNCTSLETAPSKFPASLTGTNCLNQTFGGCVALESIPAIPENVTGTEMKRLLLNCKKITSIEINGDPKTMTSALDGTSIYSVEDIKGTASDETKAYLFKTTHNAEYGAVRKALAKVPTDLTIYTVETAAAVTAAVEAVVYGLKEEKQATVAAYAAAIEDAVAGLKVAVAEANGVKYETLEAAVAADGDTVTLLADVELTESLDVAEDLTINLNGNTISGEFDNTFGMIYVKKGATLTVEGEGTITSSATYAIGNYGTVVVNGGTIESTAEDTAALYNFYYQADWYGVSTINGGSVGTVWNCGELTVTNGTVDYLDNSGALVVEGGTITELYAQDGSDAAGVEGAGTIAIEDTSAISVPDGYELVKVSEGVYKVSEKDTEPEKTYVAEADGVKYETLAEAYEAAVDGSTVTLLGNASGAGVVIDKDVTIDLGGFTYTFTEGVGSTGTESNGFQILKGNTVVLKNGTLNVATESADKFYTIIQNYANLTVENMTLDGTNLDKWSTTDGDSYVLSVNSGNVSVTGNTNIIANDDGDLAFAFDSCEKANYEAPVVTVATTGTITGKIESTGGDIAVSSGTFTVALDPDWCAEGFIPNDNGDGTYGVKVEDEEENYVATVDGKSFNSLDAALDYAKAEGMTEVEVDILDDVAYTSKIAQFKKVTFTGTDRKQTFDLNVNGALDINTELVFNNLTVSRLDSDWLYHYTYIRGGLTFNDCKMVGLFNVTAQDTDFIECDFYNDDTFGDGSYSIWLYNCYDNIDVNITDCTFNVYERAIKMYGDGYTGAMTLNISGTEFVSRTADKTVVEMAYDKTTGTGSMRLNIDNSTASGFGAPEHIDGEENAWFNVENTSTTANTISIVTIDGVVVYSDAVAKIGDDFYMTLAEALEAAAKVDGAVTVKLLSSAEWETGAAHGSTPLVPADSSAIVTIEGNDYTITATGAGVGSLRAANGTLLTFNNVNFVDESVSYAEGAWEFTYLEFAGKLKFVDCDFRDEIQIDTDNDTAPNTGAEFIGCTFESNEESVYAVWVGSGAVSFDDCYFTGYRALKLHEAYGSEIDTVSVENCKFENITKKSGIVIGDLNTDTSVNVKNCTMTNVAAGDQNAYLYESDTDVTTFNLNLTKNTVTVNGESKFPVAEIGDNQYGQLSAAIDATNGNGTVTLLRDVTEANVTVKTPAVATYSTNGLTIDLNGFTLTGNLIVETGATVNIQNGTVICKDGSYDTIKSLGNLTLTDVNADGERHIVRAKAGTLTINGGTYKYTGSATGTRNVINIGDYDNGQVVSVVEATINGGTFIGPKGTSADSGAALTVQSGSSATVYGGTFSNGKNSTLAAQDGATLTVFGGFFDQDPTVYVAENYVVTSNADKTLYSVNGLRTITLTPSAEEVETSTEFEVAVYIDTTDAKGVKWVLDYNEEYFELVSLVTDYTKMQGTTNLAPEIIRETGVIDASNPVATYTFKSKNAAVNDSEFKLTAVSIKTEAEAWNDLTVENIKIKNTDVTVILRTLDNVAVKYDGADVTNNSIDDDYDGDEHDFTVSTTTDGATITYTVNGTETTEAPEIKDAGTYVIEYSITKDGYTAVEGNVTITMGDPIYVVEVAFGVDSDYVDGTKLVLVYTDAENVTFDFDGVQMFDVTAAGYKYNNTESYEHVYALVVEALDGVTDIAGYEAKVSVDYKEKATVISYEPNNDINLGGTVTWDDIMAAYSVIEKSEYAFNNQMAGFIKADTNRDKKATSADVTPIINDVYNVTAD